ncbi:TetR family transcriptional regulator [Microbacterium sp. Se5.02b]|uniref:TetR/AcrR family transcriptional regulator n=1 Tax=Microbacterium sp. Se5.02b TaxID=2864103 RepID=UPI0028681DD2|nr:TetR family transcriptional regulator [Microbacterium sp. Se5.02b]
MRMESRSSPFPMLPSVPSIMAPRAKGLTWMPVLPRVRYCMSCSFRRWRAAVRCSIVDRSGTPFRKHTERRSVYATPGGSMRADARRNADALTDAAREVFATEGVDAPARLIAERAGVGVGTLYRRFPTRSDLVVAVFRHAVDATAVAADELAAAHAPDEALALWLQRFTQFIATKRGLAAALHSGDPAFEALPSYFTAELGGALERLLDAAADAGTIRPDVDARQLLYAAANLCHPPDRRSRARPWSVCWWTASATAPQRGSAPDVPVRLHPGVVERDRRNVDDVRSAIRHDHGPRDVRRLAGAEEPHD